VKIVVPYIGELQGVDARMCRLIEFVGIPYETLPLAEVAEHAEFLEDTVPASCSCFVVNPRVIKEWLGPGGISADLISFLLSRFSHVLVHGLHADTFDSELVAALSQGKLRSVETIDVERPVYLISEDSTQICEAFSGLSFGPVNLLNDHVLCTSGCDSEVDELISIGSQPFMALVRFEGTEVLFVASEDVADLNAEVGEAPLTDYFSRLLPHAMALRHVAGDKCWRPSKASASIIIDDPLLRERYGFLNFESLLRFADKHNFHVTIAFIPHNFRRNSSRITRMFWENAARLSICFHGNDHTEAEFASTDPDFLNTSLRRAEDRMNLHHQATSLRCDRVMAFPQGHFSVEAMRALKSHNFIAAMNRIPHPAGSQVQLTIGELAQPAVLRYGGFPLFLRNPIRETQNQDIAFNLFFGRPILMGEHHEIFQSPEILINIAARINSFTTKVHWCNPETVAGNSILMRRAPDGTHHVRAYSNAIQISNDSGSIRRYSIEWYNSCESAPIERVLIDGALSTDLAINDDGFRFTVQLAPNTSQTFTLVHPDSYATVGGPGLNWRIRAFIRRRLSELRDNYLTKNQHLLAAAIAFQRRFLRI
jgi:hypothetical protein